MWRAVIVDGVGSSTQDQTSRLESEFGESRGAREQLRVDVELTETADDPENNLVSTATYQSGPVSKPVSLYAGIGLTGGYAGYYNLDSVQ